MEYFAGLDVSLETISICIVNADGDILLEKKIEAEPAAIVAVLKHFGHPFKRIGLEAGPTSSWLYSELRCIGYPAICLECRHVKAGLSAMRNKTDRNDARGIAQLVRLGWFRQVHVKSEEAQRIRMLLLNRQQLLTKAQDFENSVRGSLKVFGLRIGTITRTDIRSTGVGARCGQSELAYNHRADVACPPSADRGIRAARPLVPAARAARSCLPQVDDRPRGRRGCISDLSDRHRRTRALPKIARCRGAFRPDAKALQLRADRL